MKKYKFRKKDIYQLNDKHNNWQNCTAEEMEQIKQNAPLKFEFKEDKKPEPTPSMIIKDEPIDSPKDLSKPKRTKKND